MRIGLLLGSFDPIHNGHLHLAQRVIENNGIDHVLFVPTLQNPWKAKSTNIMTRAYMIQMAIFGNPNYSISSVETKLSAPYYTHLTLKQLQLDYPNDELILIVGSDVANEIHRWEHGIWILENFKIIPISRYLFKISSSEIRYLVKKKSVFEHLVPDKVAEIIKKFKLYET